MCEKEKIQLFSYCFERWENIFWHCLRVLAFLRNVQNLMSSLQFVQITVAQNCNAMLDCWIDFLESEALKRLLCLFLFIQPFYVGFASQKEKTVTLCGDILHKLQFKKSSSVLLSCWMQMVVRDFSTENPPHQAWVFSQDFFMSCFHRIWASVFDRDQLLML